MNTRRVAIGMVEDEIANVGVPSKDNQNPPKEHGPQGDQAPINRAAITYGEITLSFINLSQYITTQDQALTTQA